MRVSTDSKVPTEWDPALEHFLSSTYQYGSSSYEWTKQTKLRLAGVRTFVGAINTVKLRQDCRSLQERSIDDSKSLREARVHQIIESPLSPRKKTVLPCPRAAVSKKGKNSLENVLNYRTSKQILSIIPSSRPQFETEMPSGSVREFTIPTRRVTTNLSNRRPTFYWGS